MPLVDAELVEHFADVPPRLLGSSSVVVALDWACPSSVDLLRPREAIETPTRRIVLRPAAGYGQPDKPFR